MGKHDSKQTCLMLADFVNGSTVLFGLTVEAGSYEEGMRKVAAVLAQNDGKRFIEIEHPQIFIKKQFIVCPNCHGTVPMNEPLCTECRQDLRSPAALQAIKEGTARIITKVVQEMRAELEGTLDQFRIRPEHIVVLDFVPRDSRNYVIWCKVAEESTKRMIAARSGLQIPTPEQALALGKVPNANPPAEGR